jgi:hypothetical protein
LRTSSVAAITPRSGEGRKWSMVGRCRDYPAGSGISLRQIELSHSGRLDFAGLMQNPRKPIRVPQCHSP